MDDENRGVAMEPIGPGQGPGLSAWTAFFLGSAAGLAALLRSGRVLTWRRVWAALLYNGLMAMAMAWWIADKVNGDPKLIGAVCVLAGIGAGGILDVGISGILATLRGTGTASDRERKG